MAIVCQCSELWFLQLKNNRPFVGGRYRFESHSRQNVTLFATSFGEAAAKTQQAVIVVFDIIGS